MNRQFHHTRTRTIPSSLGQLGQPSSWEGFCLRTLQQYLYDKGYLPYQFVTGKSNDQTAYLLNQLLGSGWQSIPGGACAAVGVLEARLSAGAYFGPGGPGTPGGYPGSTPTTAGMFGNIDPMALIVGLGVLGLVLALRK